MIMLHVLAGFCALVLGGVAWMLHDAGSLPLWKLMLFPLGGLALPYVVGIAWVFAVAPPNLVEMWRARRSSPDRDSK